MKIRYTIHEKSKMIGAVEEVDERLGNRLIATHCAVPVTEDELAAEAKESAVPAVAPATAPTVVLAAELEDEPSTTPARRPAPKTAK